MSVPETEKNDSGAAHDENKMGQKTRGEMSGKGQGKGTLSGMIIIHKAESWGCDNGRALGG
jgi:hypothetical protein